MLFAPIGNNLLFFSIHWNLNRSISWVYQRHNNNKMRMTFFWTTDLGEFFFPGLKVNGVLPLALLCLVVGVVSIVYEAIKVICFLFMLKLYVIFIEYIFSFLQVHSANVRARAAREQIAAVSCAPSETANLLVADQNSAQKSFSKRLCKLCSEAVVFLFHNSIGYAIMLSCMVYSGWLFVAVVLSMGLGYFLFGHISMKINMENVQARTNTVICSPACPETGESVDGEHLKINEHKFLFWFIKKKIT